ncbi:MAG: vWA domain-containing protein [Polyangiales bacterium]
MKRVALALSVLVSGFSVAACSGAATSQPEAPAVVEDTGSAPEETAPPEDTGAPVVEDSGAPEVEVDSGKVDPTPVCESASGVYTATPTPHDVLFLLDRSGSMHSKVASGSTRWQAASKALSSLLDAIGDSATRAGLDMFPRGDAPITCCWIDPATNYTSCDCGTGELPTAAKRCAQSTYGDALVPLATLGDAQKSAMRMSIHSSDAEFYWGTPMKAALAGAIAKQAALDLDGSRSVVLITDGEPTSCNATDDKIDAVISSAKAGLALAKPVQTYVVGVIDGSLAANASNLSKVAVAGGTARTADCEKTNSCFYAVDAKTFESDIAKAFKDIEMKAFSCTFDVPTLASGAPDYDLMNVSLKKTDGTSTTIPHDVAKAEGWELTADKKKVQLYGSACTAVKADTSTQVQIVLGCKTVEK